MVTISILRFVQAVQCSRISAESAARAEVCTGMKLAMSRSWFYSVAAHSRMGSERRGSMVRETTTLVFALCLMSAAE